MTAFKFLINSLSARVRDYSVKDSAVLERMSDLSRKWLDHLVSRTFIKCPMASFNVRRSCGRFSVKISVTSQKFCWLSWNSFVPVGLSGTKNRKLLMTSRPRAL